MLLQADGQPQLREIRSLVVEVDAAAKHLVPKCTVWFDIIATLQRASGRTSRSS